MQAMAAELPEADPPHGALAFQLPVRHQLEAALQDLDRLAIDVQARAAPAQEQFNDWLDSNWDVLNNPDNQDIPIPPHINLPLIAATQDVNRILHERAALASEWESAGIEAEMPHHGLPPGSLLAGRIDEAQAHRQQLTGELTQLQMATRNLSDEQLRLSLSTAPGARVALARVENSIVQRVWSRYHLLMQWDAAGLGHAVPHHGLTPEAGRPFHELEAMDASRLSAHARMG